MGTVMARGFVLACLVAGVASATHAGTSNSAFMQEGAKDPNLLKGTIWDKTLVRDVTLATDMAPVSPLNTAEAMGRCEVCVYVIENKEGHQPYLCRGLRDPHYQQTCEAVQRSVLARLRLPAQGGRPDRVGPPLPRPRYLLLAAEPVRPEALLPPRSTLPVPRINASRGTGIQINVKNRGIFPVLVTRRNYGGAGRARRTLTHFHR